MSDAPEPAADRAVWHRLHPSSLLFTLGGEARRFLFPALAFLLLSRGRGAELWFAVLFVPAAVSTLLRYLTYTYRLADDEMVIRNGLIFRNERHVPYDRIQSVDLVQNPLHRILGVAEVQVQTASGRDAEASLRVLAVDAVEEMRRRVFRGRAAGEPVEGTDGPLSPGAPAARTLARLGPSDLAVLRIVTHRGLVVVFALLGLIWQYTAYGDDPEAGASLFRRLVESVFRHLDSGAGVVFLLASLAAGLALVAVLSIGWALVKFWGFALTGDGDDLRTSCGLLTRVSATIPRHRIQALTVRETPLHRLFGRVSVRAQTAGGGLPGREEDAALRVQWLAPLLATGDLERLIDEVQPESRIRELDWKPVHPRAGGRIFRRGLARAVPWTVLPILLLGWPGASVGIVLAAVAALRGVIEPRRMGWAVGEAGVAYRSGWWTRTLSLVRHGKVQSVTLDETPFDRRAGMATVWIDTAGGLRGTAGMRIRFLGRDVAEALRERLAAAAAATEFRW